MRYEPLQNELSSEARALIEQLDDDSGMRADSRLGKLLSLVLRGKKAEQQSRQTLRVIADLGGRHEPAIIISLAPYLFNTDRAIAHAAATAIEELFKTLCPLDYVGLHNRLRIGREWYGGERRHLPTLSEDHLLCPSTLGVLSCHTSGFVREEAIAKMRFVRMGPATAFLLFRLNDWVPEVRSVAQDVFRANLADFKADDVLEFLTAVLLFKWRRQTLTSSFEQGIREVQSFLDTPEGATAILRTLSALRGKSCFALFDFAWQLEALDKHEMVDQISVCHDPITRVECVRRVYDLRSSDLMRSTISRFKSDVYPRVRRECVRLACALGDPVANEAIMNGVIDKSRCVRDIAQYHAAKRGVALDGIYTNFLNDRSPYRQAIGLSGLVETGNPMAGVDLNRFVRSGNATIRTAAICAMSAAKDPSYNKAILQATIDQSARVSRTAVRAVSRRIDEYDAAELVELAKVAPDWRLAGVISVLEGIPRWNRLILFARIARSLQGERKAVLIEPLGHIRSSYSRLGGTLTDSERERITEALRLLRQVPDFAVFTGEFANQLGLDAGVVEESIKEN
jgi:hypothetical protein